MRMYSEKTYREDDDDFDGSFGFPPLFQPLFEPLIRPHFKPLSASFGGAKQRGKQETPPQQVDEGKQIPFPVEITQETTSRQEFLDKAELLIFGRVIGLPWSGGADTMLNDIKNHIGETVTLNVHISTLERYGIAIPTDPKDKKHKENGELTGLPEKERKEINSEADKRYYARLKTTKGSRIKSPDSLDAEVWKDIRDELLAEKKQIDNLSAATKDFIKLNGKVEPADYAKIIEIVKLLKKFSASDMLDYQGMINLETTDPDVVIQSLQAYLQNKKEEQKDAELNENIKIKLYGLEGLYKKYKALKKLEGDYAAAGAKLSVHEPNPYEIDRYAELGKKKEKEKEVLTQLMQENGFSSIGQFSRYVLAYQKSFEQQTIHVAEHHLMVYRNFLFKEREKINRKKEDGKDAYITTLFKKIKASNAKANYDEAHNKSVASRNALGSRSYGNDFATGENATRSTELSNESLTERNVAEAKIAELSSLTKLVNEDQFDRVELANVSSEQELQNLLNGYITKKEESIVKTREEINEDPEKIYGLNELLKISKKAQQIEEGSIFDLIIKDKIEELGGAKLLEAVYAFVIAVALIVLNIVSLGASTGLTIAVAAATLGFSAFSVYEAITAYEEQDAANDVGFLKDDPSYVWVLIAILGAVADAAAFTKVLKAAKGIKEAAEILNAGNFEKFEQKILEIGELEQKVKDNLIKQGRLKTRITEVGIELRSRAGSIPDPVLMLEYVVLSLRNGTSTFADFIKDLKIAKLIKETGFSSDQLKELKDLFTRAKSLSKDERLMAKFEKALAEKDIDTLRTLLQSTVNLSEGGVKVIFNGVEVPIYRGGNSFKLKAGEFKTNPETGMVKTTYGVSLDVDANTISKFGGAYQIESIPERLKIIQRGSRLEHFEIVPSYEMSVEEFQDLLNKIKTVQIK